MNFPLYKMNKTSPCEWVLFCPLYVHVSMFLIDNLNANSRLPDETCRKATQEIHIFAALQ